MEIRGVYLCTFHTINFLRVTLAFDEDYFSLVKISSTLSEDVHQIGVF